MPTVAKKFQISLYDHVEADFGKLWGQLQCGIFGRLAINQRITVYPFQEPQEDGSVEYGRDPNVLPRFLISIDNLQKKAVAERMEAKPTTYC